MKKVLVLDFGGQYNLLVARRVRECGIYCEIKSYRMTMDEIRAFAPDALIFTGGPATVFEEGAPMVDPAIFELGVPVLGICYGLQLMIHLLGGECRRAETREYGKVELTHSGNSPLFDGVPEKAVYWMSHGVEVGALGPGFEVIGSTAGCAHAAVQCKEKKLYGVQFHPEVLHTVYGTDILKNFLYKICGFAPEWTMASYLEEAVEDCRRRIGSGKVLLALSGGVDSSVAAALLQRAVGDQLTCIFVDHGLLRKDEGDMVERVMTQQFHVNVRRVNAGARFLGKLAGVTEPEKKRKIIGNEFVTVFDEASAKIENAEFLAQGTTYPDVIESVPIDGNPAAMIKSHHNVGGLPEEMKFKLLEPLSRLFKDEVREVGRQLGLPEDVVMRQPFPGPGLAVRHLGAVTRETLDILRDADEIVVDEIKKAGLYYSIWQTFAVFLPVRTVGVMGDERTYDYVIALRAVESSDGMTADWVQLPYDLLGRISSRIINEVNGVNRVVYDITSKPPGTIEWE